MTAEAEKKTIRQELNTTLEQKWQTARWVTKHLDNNEDKLKE